MSGCIYLIRNLVNGKGYIGQTINMPSRWRQHINAARRGVDVALYRAIRKHGEQNFTITEVASCDRILLNDLERHYIKFYGTRSILGHGYNETDGGDGGRGICPSIETRQKQSLAKKGRKLSEDVRRKMSEAHKKRIRTPHSEETRLKLSLANKGHRDSEETKKKKSESHRGMKMPPRTAQWKLKQSQAQKGKSR